MTATTPGPSTPTAPPGLTTTLIPSRITTTPKPSISSGGSELSGANGKLRGESRVFFEAVGKRLSTLPPRVAGQGRPCFLEKPGERGSIRQTDLVHPFGQI